MIKSILVATDGSEHGWSAWRYAVDIAKAYGAWLRVISVVDERVLYAHEPLVHGGLLPMHALPEPIAEREGEMERKQQEILDEVVRKTEAKGIRVRTMLTRGSAEEQIVSYDTIADVIALGHRGQRSAWDRLMLGSVADAVVRRSARPVLVSPEKYESIQRILAAYDGSAASERALHWAADVAKTLALPIDVLHVNSNPVLGAMTTREAKEYLRPYELREVFTLVRKGNAAEQIMLTAEDRGAGLIVMGAHGHGRIREALIGSVTEGVMQNLNKPVLMVR